MFLKNYIAAKGIKGIVIAAVAATVCIAGLITVLATQDNAGNKEASENERYQAYYELCREYQEKYGEGRFEEYGLDEFGSGELMGLSIVRLIDFDDDGSEELLVAYKDGGYAGSVEYTKYEVWAWQNDEMVNVQPAAGIEHGTDVSGWIENVTIDGETYDIEDTGASRIDFLSVGYDYAFYIIQDTEETMEFLESKIIKVETKTDNAALKDLPDFYFTSGVGGWATEITINEDGTFTGNYTDSNMGDTGSDYPNGSACVCDFSGKFTDVELVDEYTYSMKLDRLEMDVTPGEEWIEDGFRYIAAEPYGMESGKTFYLYLPGKPIDSLSDDYMLWIMGASTLAETDDTLPFYGLYNADGGGGFFSMD